MDIQYIIVQAGGKGSRLGYLTQNKPKALVAVENLPLLFHLFQKFPKQNFVIIADYQSKVLREYMECFSNVKYLIIEADGAGTCAGISKALEQVNENSPFALIWSDLILSETFDFPKECKDYVGISKTFSCRWSFKDGKFSENPSTTYGVAGFFIFTDKRKLTDVPDSGEFVRWLQERQMKFDEISLAGTREIGILEEYGRLKPQKCRPFNRITIHDEIVIKQGLNEQGRLLASRECAWYKIAANAGLSALPKIYEVDPLKMEFIKGKNVYEYTDLSHAEKHTVLETLVGTLKQLHQSSHIAPDRFSMKEAYYYKTMKRLNKIRNLVPYSNKREIVVNGKVCRNVFFYKRELENLVDRIKCDSFCLIHGDCTFSNIMLRENGAPVLIDPRGYFGYTEIYGDSLYDWAKLYYSIIGNYDRFNLGEFSLNFLDDQVALNIKSNHWEDMEDDFFQLTGASRESIKLLHAIIWLSLTTYAWHDYDSICGAFYNGLYYLEDVL